MVFSIDLNSNLFADLIDDTVKAGDLFKKNSQQKGNTKAGR